MRHDSMDLVDEMAPWTHLMGENLDEAADYAQRDGLDKAAFLEAVGRAYDNVGHPIDPFFSDHLRMIATDAIPPNVALVISRPLYDAAGNLRPQWLITDIGTAAMPTTGEKE